MSSDNIVIITSPQSLREQTIIDFGEPPAPTQEIQESEKCEFVSDLKRGECEQETRTESDTRSIKLVTIRNLINSANISQKVDKERENEEQNENCDKKSNAQDKVRELATEERVEEQHVRKDTQSAMKDLQKIISQSQRKHQEQKQDTGGNGQPTSQEGCNRMVENGPQRETHGARDDGTEQAEPEVTH